MPSYEPDVHVAALTYVIEHGANISYDSPPSLEFENDLARFILADGELRCELVQHFADVSVAQARVDEVLRAWEALSDLRGNVGEIRFRFLRPEVIDRNPPVPGQIRGTSAVTLNAVGAATGTVTAHLTKRSYPPPPLNFAISPDVETLVRRWDGYRSGREPLQSMAYFALTAVEAIAGGRREAAELFGVEEAVLRKLGQLSSTRGDPETARKASAALVPMLGEERAWLEQAVRELVCCVADTRSPASRPLLRMSDLIPLPPGT
ncbi:hypothetical protein BH23GEM7_BH23GEM7_37190 [soil metagenome]